MTEREMLAEIERVIAENAALLGEEPELAVRRRPHGVVRIVLVRGGRAVRGAYRQYQSVERAHKASLEANRRAHAVAKKLADGFTKTDAMRTTPIIPGWDAT